MDGQGIMNLLESAIEYRKDVRKAYRNEIKGAFDALVEESLKGVDTTNEDEVRRSDEVFRTGLHYFVARLLYEEMDTQDAMEVGLEQIRKLKG